MSAFDASLICLGIFLSSVLVLALSIAWANNLGGLEEACRQEHRGTWT